MLTTVGITGSLCLLLGWLLWRVSVNAKVEKAEHEIKVNSLEQRIEQKNVQIQILSDTTPTDVAGMLERGEF